MTARIPTVHRALLASLALAACSTTGIDLTDVRRIEIDVPIVVEGDELQYLLAHSRCQRGVVLWKGGYPARITRWNWDQRPIDGFSFYGHFFRISRDQWCEVDDEAWRRLFRGRLGDRPQAPPRAPAEPAASPR